MSILAGTDLYADFARVLVEAADAAALDLSEAYFLDATARCTVEERDRILYELPPWAQRRIQATEGIASADVIPLPNRHLRAVEDDPS